MHRVILVKRSGPEVKLEPGALRTPDMMKIKTKLAFPGWHKSQVQSGSPGFPLSFGVPPVPRTRHVHWFTDCSLLLVPEGATQTFLSQWPTHSGDFCQICPWKLQYFATHPDMVQLPNCRCKWPASVCRICQPGATESLAVTDAVPLFPAAADIKDIVSNLFNKLSAAKDTLPLDRNGQSLHGLSGPGNARVCGIWPSPQQWVKMACPSLICSRPPLICQRGRKTYWEGTQLSLKIRSGEQKILPGLSVVRLFVEMSCCHRCFAWLAQPILSRLCCEAGRFWTESN